MESKSLPRINHSNSDSHLLLKTSKRKGVLRTTTDARQVSLGTKPLERLYSQKAFKGSTSPEENPQKELQQRQSKHPRQNMKLTPEVIKQVFQEEEKKGIENAQEQIVQQEQQVSANPIAQQDTKALSTNASQASAKPKKQSRFRQFIIQKFNSPDKLARNAYKSAIKAELKDFDNLKPKRQRELKAFQEYYQIKPHKTNTTRIQKATKRFKGLVEYFERLSTFTKNIATIAQRLTPSSLHAAVQTSTQAGVTVGSASVEAAGIGLGVFLMPIQTFDAIRSLRKAIITKEKHDYANIYIKNIETPAAQKLSSSQKELLATAHYLKNQHRYWDKRIDALDASQSLVSTGLTTACALVGALAAPLLPIIIPIAGGVGLGIVTGSLGVSIGVITFKKAKSCFKWVQAKKAKKAYENPEGLMARSARRKAYRAFKRENGLKTLSRQARSVLKEEINIRAREILKQNYMQRSGKFASQELCKTLRKEQMAYYNNKQENATLEASPTLDFLKHFNVQEDIIKAVIDCKDYATAEKLLRQTLKKGISNLKRTDVQDALEDARNKRKADKQATKAAAKAAK